MGLLGSGPAASACTAPPALADTSAAGAGAVDAVTAVDGSPALDGVAKDTASDAAADTSTALDAMDAQEAMAGDTASPADVAGPEAAAQDVPPADTAKPDVASDGAGAPDATTADTAKADAVSDIGPPVCTFGKAQQECFTAKALKANIESPPMGGDSAPDAYSGVLPPEGCPDPNLVKDGCCNPAAAPGVVVGDTCCYWFCTGACCGRPLVVDGAVRVAALVSSSPWSNAGHGYCAEVGPATADPFADLDAAERAALAAAWRADAADEHAAIASFLRFGMDLLTFGAPPDLVADAAKAAADEVRHARQCCAVAQSLDGQGDGPGALQCGDLGAHASLAEAAYAAVVEGCVGETLAAVCLGTAARRAGPGALRETLQVMADDEARHAELAWRFVRWAWAQSAGAEVRRAIAAAFAQVQQGAPTRDPRSEILAAVGNSARLVAGRLPARDYAAACVGALAQIVGPCAQALGVERAVSPWPTPAAAI